MVPVDFTTVRIHPLLHGSRRSMSSMNDRRRWDSRWMTCKSQNLEFHLYKRIDSSNFCLTWLLYVTIPIFFKKMNCKLDTGTGWDVVLVAGFPSVVSTWLGYVFSVVRRCSGESIHQTTSITLDSPRLWLWFSFYLDNFTFDKYRCTIDHEIFRRNNRKTRKTHVRVGRRGFPGLKWEVRGIHK